MTSPTLTYGSFDGEPFIYSSSEAWTVRKGVTAWSRADSSEIAMGGRVLTKAAFDAKFPSLPPLPVTDAPPID
jgi:hypothetical protein